LTCGDSHRRSSSELRTPGRQRLRLKTFLKRPNVVNIVFELAATVAPNCHCRPVDGDRVSGGFTMSQSVATEVSAAVEDAASHTHPEATAVSPAPIALLVPDPRSDGLFQDSLVSEWVKRIQDANVRT